jgi:3-oxoacyl-[acyl-carrier protein] reductase
MDVTNREQVKQVFQQVKNEFGRVDILINNAATLDHVAQIPNQSYELWDRDLNVNLTGAFNSIRAVMPIMKEQNWGSIVSISSVAGVLGGFGQAGYAATKAGLIGLMKTTALELGRYNVSANTVFPGIVGTEMFQFMRDDMKDRIRKRTVWRRESDPEFVANAIVWLCSEPAHYITGIELDLSGGITLFTF